MKQNPKSDSSTSRHYIKLNGKNRPLMLLRLKLDLINEDGFYVDNRGDKFISISVNQSKFDKGSVFLTQALPTDKITEDTMRVIGTGGKTIDMDYWIEKNQGRDYLDYLFEQIRPDDGD